MVHPITGWKECNWKRARPINLWDLLLFWSWPFISSQNTSPQSLCVFVYTKVWARPTNRWQLLLSRSWSCLSSMCTSPRWIMFIVYQGVQSSKTSLCVSSKVRETWIAGYLCYLESFCNKFTIGGRISGWFGKRPDAVQSIQIICKVSRWTGKCLDDLKSVWMNWKVSG